MTKEFTIAIKVTLIDPLTDLQLQTFADDVENAIRHFANVSDVMVGGPAYSGGP
jgi:hypothetical protein